MRLSVTLHVHCLSCYSYCRCLYPVYGKFFNLVVFLHIQMYDNSGEILFTPVLFARPVLPFVDVLLRQYLS